MYMINESLKLRGVPDNLDIPMKQYSKNTLDLKESKCKYTSLPGHQHLVCVIPKANIKLKPQQDSLNTTSPINSNSEENIEIISDTWYPLVFKFGNSSNECADKKNKGTSRTIQEVAFIKKRACSRLPSSVSGADVCGLTIKIRK
uniref:Uncharacterized protein n=3 Tax=Clastoptera arizonana TaxID=38151 RepID=A0A1B6EA10_9HEMI